MTTARLDGAVNIEVQQVCADATITHGGLVRDPLVIGLIEFALDGPPLTAPPTPGQCARLRQSGSAA